MTTFTNVRDILFVRLNEIIEERGFSEFILITKTDKCMNKNINEDILY